MLSWKNWVCYYSSPTFPLLPLSSKPFSHVFCGEYFRASLPTQGRWVSSHSSFSSWLMAEATFTVNRAGVGGPCVCVSASVSVSVCVGLLLSSQDYSIVTLKPWSFQMWGLACLCVRVPVALSTSPWSDYFNHAVKKVAIISIYIPLLNLALICVESEECNHANACAKTEMCQHL